MERSTFIKLTGLTTFGIMAGGNLFASVFESQELLEIDAPKIHVRHGYFNLQEANQSGFYIQRDVFNKNGLEGISDNRMTSIKVSDKNITHFGILDKTGFKSKSKRFSTVRLKANRATSIQVDSRNLIFSEFDEFVVDGVKILK